MAANPTSTFLAKLKRIETTRSRLEVLFGQGRVALRDLHVSYEGLFLQGVVGFESLLEAVFFCILRGADPAGRAGIGPKISAKSVHVLYETVMGGDRYLKWLPYKETTERASLYLYGGRPFTELENTDNDDLAKLVTVRHAIAHASDSAAKDFQRKVIANLPLLPLEKSPAAFLRTLFRTNPKATRFEYFAGRMAQIAVKICPE